MKKHSLPSQISAIRQVAGANALRSLKLKPSVEDLLIQQLRAAEQTLLWLARHKDVCIKAVEGHDGVEAAQKDPLDG
jgi:hypothetical protein